MFDTAQLLLRRSRPAEQQKKKTPQVFPSRTATKKPSFNPVKWHEMRYIRAVSRALKRLVSTELTDSPKTRLYKSGSTSICSNTAIVATGSTALTIAANIQHSVPPINQPTKEMDQSTTKASKYRKTNFAFSFRHLLLLLSPFGRLDHKRKHT